MKEETPNHNEIPLHAHRDGYNQNVRQEQGLASKWGNWNPHPLLAGRSRAQALCKNSLEVPPKDMGQQKLSRSTGRSANWHNYFGKPFNIAG